MYFNEENPEDDFIIDINEILSQLMDIKRILKTHEYEFPYQFIVSIDGDVAYSGVHVFVDNRLCDIYSGYDFCFMKKEAHAHRKNVYIFFLQLLFYLPFDIITYYIRKLLKKPDPFQIDLREKDVIHAKKAIKNQSIHYEDARTSRSKYYFHLWFFIALISSIVIMIGSIIQYEDVIITIKNIFVPMFILLWMVLVFEISLLWKRRKQYPTLKNTDNTIKIVDNYASYCPGPEDIIIHISKTTTYDYCIEELDSFINFCINAKDKGATHLSPPPTC